MVAGAAAPEDIAKTGIHWARGDDRSSDEEFDVYGIQKELERFALALSTPLFRCNRFTTP